MIRQLDLLDKLLLHVIASSFLKGERPVNLLILGFPASGKTELLTLYASIPGVLFTTYVSFSRLLHYYGNDIIAGKIRHILIPDLAVPAGRSRDAAGGEFAALGCLIEEGILRWETTKTIFQAKLPTRVGLVGCTTRDTMDKIKDIAPPGFLSRFLHVSFRYSDGSRKQILDGISTLDHRVPMAKELRRMMPTLIEGNPELFRRLYSQEIVDQVKESGDTYGFRTQRQLQTLMMSSALLNNRAQVTLDDFLTVVEFVPYLNERYKEV